LHDSHQCVHDPTRRSKCLSPGVPTSRASGLFSPVRRLVLNGCAGYSHRWRSPQWLFSPAHDSGSTSGPCRLAAGATRSQLEGAGRLARPATLPASAADREGAPASLDDIWRSTCDVERVAGGARSVCISRAMERACSEETNRLVRTRMLLGVKGGPGSRPTFCRTGIFLSSWRSRLSVKCTCRPTCTPCL